MRAAGRLTLQDLGRPGLGHLGVPVGGAADGGSAHLAAVLVGGRPGLPLLELTASGAAFEATADLLVAVTGAVVAGPHPVTVDGVPVPVAEPLLLPRGAVLEVPAPHRGLRTYVAVAGGLDLVGGPGPLLGSVARSRRSTGRDTSRGATCWRPGRACAAGGRGTTGSRSASWSARRS